MKNIRERQVSGKNKKSVKDRIILTQKKKNFDSIRNDPFFNNKISLVNSPAQNINNFYLRNNKKNKFLNSIFGYNSNMNKIDNNSIKKSEVNAENILGYRSCSIKKNHHLKNLKVDLNKKLNNLKIININTPTSYTIKKEERNNNFIIKNSPDLNINNNLYSLNAVLKTEPKNNHFLEKVIQKINSHKDRKTIKNNMHVFMTHNNKNEDNKQIFRFLSIDKSNNNELLGCPYLLKYYKNNPNEDDKINKRSPIHLKDDKNFLNTINTKIVENSINRKSKERVKKIFPNLMIHNKK